MVNNMNRPVNYRLKKLNDARLQLLKIATSIQLLEDPRDDKLGFEVLNLADHFVEVIKEGKLQEI